MKKGTYRRNIFKPEMFFSKTDIDDLFNSTKFYETSSFNVITEFGEYDYTDHCITMAEEAARVSSAFKNGSSIRVTHMEFWNKNVARRALNLGLGTDVHMYLTPPVENPTGFKYHTDDRDVYVHMIFGRKTFYLKEDGKEYEYDLYPGDVLYIEKGMEHYAKANGASCQLSFGVPRDEHYWLATGLTTKDLYTSQEDA